MTRTASHGHWNRSALTVFVWLALANSGLSQSVTPHAGYVYPAGGQVGSTFRVRVGGQFLQSMSWARISGSGVRADVIDHTRPLGGKEMLLLRDQLKALLARKSASQPARNDEKQASTTQPAWTDADDKLIADIRKKLAGYTGRPATPGIAETVTLEVMIARDAVPGHRDLRLGGPAGLTQPLVFCVGQLPEFSEEPSTVLGIASQLNAPKMRRAARTGATKGEMEITLPAVLNGQILPGESDRFHFQAHRGQRLVVRAAARELMPYLADAVPGWFQATLRLSDADGKELAYDDDYRFSPDPVVLFQVPKDGECVLEIADALHRGREDFVYRISVGEIPQITQIFPLGAPAGQQLAIEMKGWNVPGPRLERKGSQQESGIIELTTRKGPTLSNAVPFMLDTLPECTEQEPNNRIDEAQAITLPRIVNGRISSSDDKDVFRFEGRTGDEMVMEVMARRLNSPLDSKLLLTDATGRQFVLNDDHEDKGAGLATHHADSYLRARIPADGPYYVHLTDAQHSGGVEYAYRLRISPPQPDFELRIVPSSVSARAGATIPLTVYALRRDGFAGEITLRLKEAPVGFVLSGGRIPPREDRVQFTLTVAPRVEGAAVSLSVEGRAKVGSRELTHIGEPAEDMMQAFAYHHLVPSRELVVGITGRGDPRRPNTVVRPTPVKIPRGGTARLTISPSPSPMRGELHLQLTDAPEGISLAGITPGRNSLEIVLKSDAGKMKTGMEGNLIIRGFAQRPATTSGQKPLGNSARIPLAILPAVPFEIVEK